MSTWDKTIRLNVMETAEKFVEIIAASFAE